MSREEFLAVLSIAVAVGGLVAKSIQPPNVRAIIISILFSAIIIIGVLLFHSEYQQRQRLNKIEMQLLQVMGYKEWTMDELHEVLFPIGFLGFAEVFGGMLDSGVICSKPPISVLEPNNRIMHVRKYILRGAQPCGAN